ncbi:hypothetical protein [Streptomyces sp. YS-3]|uniref:hypothetical protein n=1 Tax=Streptomyces sp. YS-3 TaxID=3381352 RepID=UPI0038627021
MAVLEHDRHDRTIRTPQRASRANGPGLALTGVATLVRSGSFAAWHPSRPARPGANGP